MQSCKDTTLLRRAMANLARMGLRTPAHVWERPEMPKSTVTFELGGRVELSDLAKGITAFRRLIMALTPRSSDIRWVVEDLQPGSAIATFRGESERMEAVDDIMSEYERIGNTLARHEPVEDFRGLVVKAAGAVASLVESVEYVRFETQILTT